MVEEAELVSLTLPLSRPTRLEYLLDLYLRPPCPFFIALMSVGFFNVIISEESSDITRQVSDGRLVMAHLLLFCNVACLERAPLSNLVIVKLLCRHVVVRKREFMRGEKGTAGYSRVLSQGTPRQLADGKVVNLSSKERGFHR